MSIKRTGIFKHYEGKHYKVVAYATHIETKERLVVYKPLLEDTDTFYAMPIQRFFGSINYKGKRTLLFERINVNPKKQTYE
jgi:hypothetical protein